MAETGIALIDHVVIWCGAIATVTGVLALIWRGTRGLRRLGRRVDEFVDDWQGTPGRAGVPARPGVMERLDRIEHMTDVVAHEVRPNSGASMRDAVDRVDQHLNGPRPATPNE